MPRLIQHDPANVTIIVNPLSYLIRLRMITSSKKNWLRSHMCQMRWHSTKGLIFSRIIKSKVLKEWAYLQWSWKHQDVVYRHWGYYGKPTPQEARTLNQLQLWGRTEVDKKDIQMENSKVQGTGMKLQGLLQWGSYVSWWLVLSQ